MTHPFLRGAVALAIACPAAAWAALAAPTLSVTAASTECDLKWNAVSGATGYDVYRNGDWLHWTSGTSFANTGLTNGTTYQYTVAAQNETTTPITTGPQSSAVSCKPGSSTPPPPPPPTTTYEIVGYYPGWAAANPNPFVVSTGNIDAKKHTVVNYAFLDICWNGKHGNPSPDADGTTFPCKDGNGTTINPGNGSIVLGDPSLDSTNGGSGANNLGKLLTLKSVNPNLKLVASVGGWTWSNQFSNMAASSTTRSNFVNSAVSFLRKYKFDGIDIDWEYPTSIGVPCASGQTCQRNADKQNFVQLMKELRAALNTAGSADGKHYLTTIAAGADQSYVEDPSGSTAWIASLAGNLDWINLMTYDFHGPWETKDGIVAPLYPDAKDAAGFSSDGTVKMFLAAGVSAKKLVLGIPFYGYGWAGCAAGPNGDGLYQNCTGPATGSQDSTFDFAFLTDQGYLTKDSSGKYTVGGKGFVRRWDSASRVPYLYNKSSKVFITYDDEASVHEKTNYIKGKALRGGMYWEMNADRHKVLGTVLSNDLPH